MWMFFVAVEIGSRSAAAGQFFGGGRVAFDFGEGRTRSQTQLFGEDVENAGETNQRREFRDRSGREISKVNLALFARCHGAVFTTKTLRHEADKSSLCLCGFVVKRPRRSRLAPLPCPCAPMPDQARLRHRRYQLPTS